MNTNKNEQFLLKTIRIWNGSQMYKISKGYQYVAPTFGGKTPFITISNRNGVTVTEGIFMEQIIEESQSCPTGVFTFDYVEALHKGNEVKGMTIYDEKKYMYVIREFENGKTIPLCEIDKIKVYGNKYEGSKNIEKNDDLSDLKEDIKEEVKKEDKSVQQDENKPQNETEDDSQYAMLENEDIFSTERERKSKEEKKNEIVEPIINSEKMKDIKKSSKKEEPIKIYIASAVASSGMPSWIYRIIKGTNCKEEKGAFNQVNRNNMYYNLVTIYNALKSLKKPNTINIMCEDKALVDMINKDLLSQWYICDWKKENGEEFINKDILSALYKLINSENTNVKKLAATLMDAKHSEILKAKIL